MAGCSALIAVLGGSRWTCCSRVPSLDDVDAAVSNGEHVTETGLSPAEEAHIAERPTQDDPFTGLFAVPSRTERRTTPSEEIRPAAQLSPRVKEFVEEKYDGATLPSSGGPRARVPEPPRGS